MTTKSATTGACAFSPRRLIACVVTTLMISATTVMAQSPQATKPEGPVLRDIHLPPPPSWWPPAPGWWIVTALILVAIAWTTRWAIRRRRVRQWQRAIRAEIDAIAVSHAAQPDSTKVATDVSQLLRRASLLIDKRAATLSGEQWLAFLDEQVPEGQGTGGFVDGPGRVLIDAPYRRTSTVDTPALIALTRRWLRNALAERHPWQRSRKTKVAR